MRKREVLEHFGGVTQTADALDISRQAVHQWPDPIPEGMAYKLQVLTAGKLKVREELYKAKRA